MSAAKPSSNFSSSMNRADSTVSPQAALSPHGTITPPGCVDSTEILRGQKTVEIRHMGTTYRLQATRLGKLILTK